MKSFDAEGVQFAWDATSITRFTECPRKYQYASIEGWQLPGKSDHLRFGGHYASALEHFHKHRAAGASHEEALRLIIREALIETWDHERDAEGNRIPSTGGPWISSNNLKTRENLIRSIVWYFEQYADDAMSTFIASDGTPAVEYSFSFPVDDGIVFAGHLDRLVEYSGKLMVQDQKTTGSTPGQYYFDQFAPDIQMSMYTFAGKIIFDQSVSGVVIDAAQIAVGFTRFERGFTYRLQAQLDEWYDNTMRTIEDARHATRERHFPMRTTSCGNYGGCAFRRICSRSPEVREQFLKGDFERGLRWDPLERR